MSQIEPVQSRLTRKILVTFLGGCVAFFIANMISEGFVFQVATGVFVGGVLLVTFYLIEVDHRLAQTEASQRVGLLKINEATELFGLVGSVFSSPCEQYTGAPVPANRRRLVRPQRLRG
jgi:hypothetical protein